jgi:hypothetical protein
MRHCTLSLPFLRALSSWIAARMGLFVMTKIAELSASRSLSGINTLEEAWYDEGAHVCRRCVTAPCAASVPCAIGCEKLQGGSQG